MAEWKDTCNLPRTAFAMKANLQTTEPDTVARWNAMDLYGQIRAACRQGVGVLLISSELDELIDVADRILVLYPGRVMGHCPAEPAA